MFTQKQCAYTLASALMWVIIYSVIPVTHASPNVEDRAIAMVKGYTCGAATARAGGKPEELAKCRWRTLTLADYHGEWIAQRMAIRGIADHNEIQTEYRTQVPADRRAAEAEAAYGNRTVEIVTSFPASPTYPAHQVRWLVFVNLKRPTEGVGFSVEAKDQDSKHPSGFLYHQELPKTQRFLEWCGNKARAEMSPPLALDPHDSESQEGNVFARAVEKITCQVSVAEQGERLSLAEYFREKWIGPWEGYVQEFRGQAAKVGGRPSIRMPLSTFSQTMTPIQYRQRSVEKGMVSGTVLIEGPGSKYVLDLEVEPTKQLVLRTDAGLKHLPAERRSFVGFRGQSFKQWCDRYGAYPSAFRTRVDARVTAATQLWAVIAADPAEPPDACLSQQSVPRKVRVVGTAQPMPGWSPSAIPPDFPVEIPGFGVLEITALLTNDAINALPGYLPGREVEVVGWCLGAVPATTPGDYYGTMWAGQIRWMNQRQPPTAPQ